MWNVLFGTISSDSLENEMRTLPVVTILLLLSTTLTASTDPIPSKDKIGPIVAMCANIDKGVEKNTLSIRYFVNLGGSDKPDRWKEYPSLKACNRACENGCDDSAVVYFQDKKLILADCSFSSRSGDWAMYVMYYYRNDGTLAKAEIDSRRFGCLENDSFDSDTFLGQAKWDEFFDVKGKPLHKTPTRYFNMDTKKRLQKLYGFGSMLDDRPIYLKPTELPFNEFLR
jgi:hypothetical protein